MLLRRLLQKVLFYSWQYSHLRERCRSHVIQPGMRPIVIVVHPPAIRNISDFVNAQERFADEQLIPYPALEIEALIESGRLGLDMKKHEDAVRDAGEALKICERTGFKLNELGAEIVLAKAYLAQKDFVKAESNTKSAYEKAVGMKYRWAEGKLKKFKD